LSEWNAHTAPYRRGIDEVFPGLLDTQGPRANVDLTKKRAHELYDAEPSSKDLVVKCHLIELLNYCEYVAVSFQREVGDRKILEESFQETLRRWHYELSPFIEVTKERRGYNPWRPFSKFIESLPTSTSDSLAAAR